MSSPIPEGDQVRLRHMLDAAQMLSGRPWSLPVFMTVASGGDAMMVLDGRDSANPARRAA